MNRTILTIIFSVIAFTLFLGLHANSEEFLNRLQLSSANGSELVTTNFDDTKLFLSPCVWRRPGDGTAWLNTGGGSFVVKVSGTTQLTLNIDPSINLNLEAKDKPCFRVTVNSLPSTYLQASTANTLLLASGLSGINTIRVECLGGNQQAGDGWTTSIYTTKLTGLSIDSGGSFLPFSPSRKKRILFFGDSYLQSYSGSWTSGAYYQYVDYTRSWASYLASALEAEFSVVAAGGVGYTIGNRGSGYPAMSHFYDHYDSSHERIFDTLDYVFIALGSNDHGVSASLLSTTVKSLLSELRTKVKLETVIFLSTPPGGDIADYTSGGTSTLARDGIFEGVAAYIQATGDKNAFVVDLGCELYPFLSFAGGATTFSQDGIHPTWNEGHPIIAAKTTQKVQGIVCKAPQRAFGTKLVPQQRRSMTR